jgi:hypothetical protein
MGSFSNYLENKILEHIIGKTAYTMPTAYLALCTADPTDAGTGASMNEVSNSNGYARVATSGADWGAAASGAIANAVEKSFSEASGSWGTPTHFAILDSGTYGAGNMLVHGSITTPKAIASGDTPKFAIGELDITLD